MMGLFSKSNGVAPAAAPVSGAAAALGEAGIGRQANGSTQAFAPAYIDLKLRLHQQMLEVMNLSVIDKMPQEQIRREVGELVKELLSKESVPLNNTERTQLVNDIFDEFVGLGPIEPLLKDPTVTDILVNTSSHVFVERGGHIEMTPVRFKDDRHLLRIINKIVTAVGRRIDESQPTVDARLADGSRVNAVVPPVAVDGPLLSIRKFAKIPYTMEKLVEGGTVTQEIAE